MDGGVLSQVSSGRPSEKGPLIHDPAAAGRRDQSRGNPPESDSRVKHLPWEQLDFLVKLFAPVKQ